MVPTHVTAEPTSTRHSRALTSAAASAGVRTGLYTPDERRRRDTSSWTLVQGVLAPLQFLVMAVSVFLVVRYLQTGNGLVGATA